MPCLIAYLLLATVVDVSLAHRSITSSSVNKLQSLVPEGCPAKVSMNRREECINKETKAVVADNCCDDLLWCNEHLAAISEKFRAKMMDYYTNCSLQETDLAPNSEGKFQVVDNTRLCDPKCQNQLVLHEYNLPSYKSVEVKCAGNAGFIQINQMDDIVNALYSSFCECTPNSCTTTSTTTTITTATTTTTTTTVTTRTTTTTTATTITTTTTTTTATSITTTTTTTLDYFDFTYFFNTARDYGRSHALFPNGDKYYCCCHPDYEENTMTCVLKDTRIESFTEGFRHIFWSTCPAAIGGDYKNWHNVFDSSAPTIRPEFDGLRHVAECVVPIDKLPEDFQRMSYRELARQLHEFRQEHKEYPEEFEEMEAQE